jgi:hypothetical protein
MYEPKVDEIFMYKKSVFMARESRSCKYCCLNTNCPEDIACKPHDREDNRSVIMIFLGSGESYLDELWITIQTNTMLYNKLSEDF